MRWQLAASQRLDPGVRPLQRAGTRRGEGECGEKEASMFSRHVIAASVLLAWSVAAPPSARAEEVRSDGRAVVVYGAGGGFNSFAHLDAAETTNFKTGFNVGAGAGYQFNRYVALRGNFTFARAEAQSDLRSISIAGTKFNRLLY